ncbi:chymotrypsin-like protease CTRL-1 [Chelonus insularis]|uniref:chymotrypsin-like protease CTRL-1 n=1 Tax=Chelonus insularis TaxID=460826 RepID=UPI00158AAB14|nr:chymotrypsin-like protease CTRL-1 [Chelonus insularis]
MALRGVLSFAALLLIFHQSQKAICITHIKRSSFRYKSNVIYKHSYSYSSRTTYSNNMAMNGQFPWMAVIHQMKGNYKIHICGGTVISVRWVLTAGHCIEKRPRKFLVVFGDVDRSNIGYETYHGKGIAMITTSGVIHSDYRKTVNDIALLYMPRDIPFSARIQPIKLAGKYDEFNTYVGWTSYVFGWGLDGITNNVQRRLKFGRIPIISNKECSKKWKVSDSVLCTAAGTGVDACQGDSGGPLIVYKDNQYVQIGIVSYGDSDCPSTLPGVFTKISFYHRWIRSVTGIKYY